jgi:hypothetical protein
MSGSKKVKIGILKKILDDKKADWGKKLLALISLARIASDEAISVLQVYYFDPDPKMKAYAKRAFEEAKYFAKAERCL